LCGQATAGGIRDRNCDSGSIVREVNTCFCVQPQLKTLPSVAATGALRALVASFGNPVAAREVQRLITESLPLEWPEP
jgi:hypothetical protein